MKHLVIFGPSNDLAKAVDRYIFMEDVMIKVKKITKDDTAQRIRTKSVHERDKWVYEKTKQCYFNHDVEKLKKAMQ